MWNFVCEVQVDAAVHFDSICGVIVDAGIYLSSTIEWKMDTHVHLLSTKVCIMNAYVWRRNQRFMLKNVYYIELLFQVLPQAVPRQSTSSAPDGASDCSTSRIAFLPRRALLIRNFYSTKIEKEN